MKTEQEKIEKAIVNKNSIDFKYRKKDGNISNRTGNPHIIYIYTNKKGEMEIKVGIFQTSGDTASSNNSFKDFLAIEDILDVVIHEDIIFEIDTEFYNPNSSRYINVIKKV